MQTLDVARRRFLLAIFVVSGFTGLIYESIWSHYLKLLLGHAAYAQSLVLAIFMGGMALGSWLIARYSFRIRRLLLAYVVVEEVIGALGLLECGAAVVPLADSLTAGEVLETGDKGALPGRFVMHGTKSRRDRAGGGKDRPRLGQRVEAHFGFVHSSGE